MMPPFPMTTPDITKPASNAGNLGTFASIAPYTNAPSVSKPPLATSKLVALYTDAHLLGKRLLPRPLAGDPLGVPHTPSTWLPPNLALPPASYQPTKAVPHLQPTSMTK